MMAIFLRGNFIPFLLADAAKYSLSMKFFKRKKVVPGGEGTPLTAAGKYGFLRNEISIRPETAFRGVFAFSRRPSGADIRDIGDTRYFAVAPTVFTCQANSRTRAFRERNSV
jgi:hypothetical protein